MARTTTLLACLASLTIATVLLGSPSSATVQTNDAITRSFHVTVLAQAQFPGGLGIVSPSGPCPATVLSGMVSVGESYYYQGDRTVTNFKAGTTPLPTGQPPIVLFSGPCPILASGPGSPTILTIPNTNLFLPFDGLDIEQRVCIQAPLSASCFIDPANLLATLALCRKDDVAFLPGPPDGKSALAGLAGSRAIDCLDSPGDPSDGFRNPTTYRGGAPGYCASWAIGTQTWSTDFCRIQVEDVVPLGNDRDDTGYVVACMRASNVRIFDPLENPATVFKSFESHDYILALDLDGTPENWLEAKLQHWDNNLQGWHDLGGKNGFPCPTGAAPPNKLLGDFPILPTPLSPKP